ncbi:STAS/SEC14 domain-containing protein [Rhodocyclus tenuis]|uniref:STAS/SEC14 domain-containing protein n=2 Tax=Rhodocyclus TaxID=1064 RepID=A0A6L5JWB9_RHOTE|nr:STAS/SEC14 domain-containing protein [Rhodocyclus gracilis]MQY51663.1 STAS/SEC14 domain-containing protein [Rhodocyclus gracilis]MRD73144.1 STAS/SEC14 domain-containing protein [Rhodocyclus gracilis]NJA89076.1 STAS/SEC14 domain-containing protein [Rhodocyclus gracilis]
MILTDRSSQRVEITVLGEFTLADFKEFEGVFDAALKASAAQDQPLDLYFDVREMAGVTVDVAWEEVVFSRAHGKDLRRIAVVAEHRWEAWAVWLTKLSAAAEFRVFADAQHAQAWLAA